MNRNMKRMIAVSVGLAIVVIAALAVVLHRWPVVQAAATTREAPVFQVDPAWPKIPNGWTFGQVSSVASDPQGNIWIFQRPRTIRSYQKTGPAVMEFDQEGNYIKGWGGPGDGYDWPKSEHGIYIDGKGFVWISGNGNDDQILKFTQDGKFMLQIGHGGHKKTNADTENLWKPADVFVAAKTNELYVADGYGNKRVIVFDADTGKFKRMWGAFGNTPEDDPAPQAGGEGGAPGGGRGRGADPNRPPAKELAADDPGPKQFNTVHGIKVSNDGFVYVADRAGKRVQVFTTEGKYLSQIWIDRWCETTGEACGNGQTTASVAFSSDAEQRFLYVASRSPARVWVYDRKKLEPIYYFGSPGVAPGQFYALHEMVTDPKGNLYTTEVEDGRRVQKFVYKGLAQVPVTQAPTPVAWPSYPQ
jgi:DNA-binding beta-propeller fold protein YncE